MFAQHKESLIEEGHMMVDPVNMMFLMPPEYAVSNSGRRRANRPAWTVAIGCHRSGRIGLR